MRFFILFFGFGPWLQLSWFCWSEPRWHFGSSSNFIV